MADEDVDIWPSPQELKSTLNAWPKVRKFGGKNTAFERFETLVVLISGVILCSDILRL